MFCVSLLSTLVASWTFSYCQDSICDGNYNQSLFSVTTINQKYNDNCTFNRIMIKNDDIPEDITINVDNISINVDLYFENINSAKILYIETAISNDLISLPHIDAPTYNIVISNKNSTFLKNILFIRTMRCLSVKSGDNRELKIVFVSKPCNPQYYLMDIENFVDSSISIQGLTCHNKIYKELTDSKVINIEPLLAYQYWSDNCDTLLKKNEYYEYQIKYLVDSNIKCNVIYGKRKVTLIFSNQKTLTIKSENPRGQVVLKLADGSSVTCEDGLASSEVIPPCITMNSIGDLGEGITLKGSWPTFKKTTVPREYFGNKLWIRPVYLFSSFQGKFIYSAQNFPAGDIMQNNDKVELILTNKNSSITGSFLMNNLTIKLQNDEETEFYINGEIRSFDYYQDKIGFLVTYSSKLSIFASVIKRNVTKVGPANVFYRTIDNCYQYLEDAELNVAPYGRVINPYAISFNDMNSFGTIYNDYTTKNSFPEQKGYKPFFNYGVKFATDQISEISKLLDKLGNNFPRLHVNPPPTGDYIDLIVRRSDYPFAALYKATLNQQLNSICSKNGLFNKSRVKTVVGSSFIEGYNNNAGGGFDIEHYLPIVAEQNITGNSFISDDKKCIGFVPTSIPGSSFEIFVYTSNTTYIGILEKIKIISLLKPDDLDSRSKLFNPKSKNIFILCFDDTPTDKALNFKDGIREDANIFLLGIPFKGLNDILTTIDFINELNTSDPNFDKTKYDKIKQLIVKYTDYIPKVNILLGKVQSLMVVLVDFIGTNIECSNFFTLGSKFSRSNKISLSAATTIADTESYFYFRNDKKSFNNLILIPFQVSPPNLLEINSIIFGPNEWMLNYSRSSLNNNEHFIFNSKGSIKVDADKVVGNLIIISITKLVDFIISDGFIGSSVKGAGIITDINTFLDIRSIPGMFVLEDNDQKKKTDNMKRTLRDLFTTEGMSILKGIFNTLPNNQKNVRLFEAVNEPEKTVIKFTGWEKIKEIKGEMLINTGKNSVEAEKIPDIVMEVSEFKSSEKVNLQPISKETVLSKPQIISTIDKKYSFPDGQIVSFSNITFNDKNALLSSQEGNGNSIFSLSLEIGAKSNSKITTDHLKITQATIVDLSTTPIDIKSSIELEPEAIFIANSLVAEKTKLILNYRLSAEFARIPDNYDPVSIQLNYIGEGTDEALLDYSEYLGAIYNIKIFSTNEKCTKWKNMITLSSEYKDFQQGSSSIQLICSSLLDEASLLESISSTPSFVLQLNVTEIPTTAKVVKQIGSKNKSPMGIIIGGVVGGVAVIAIISVIVWFFAHKKKGKVEGESNEENNEDNNEENKP